jgi:hypothetical protein
MSDTALTKQTDGFGGYEDGIEGDDQQRQSGIIRGAVLKFLNEGAWVTREGLEVPPDLELIAVDIGRVVQKWHDQQPIQTIVLQPMQRFPNLEELNASVPRDQWEEGPDGNPRGPWQAQHIVYLLNADTMDRYSVPTGTIGGARAVRDLVDKTRWMRKFRGETVFPKVTLSNTFMKTRFGGRLRPCFLIKSWVDLSSGEQVEQASPAPQLENMSAQTSTEKAAPPAPETKAPAPAKPTPVQTAKSGARTVEQPTLGEEMRDRIRF